MKCRNCKRTIEDNSLFCNWCGEKQIKEKKKKDEISVPKPVLHGKKWRVVLRAENVIISEDTPEEALVKARAVRAGFLEIKKSPQKMTVGMAVNNFINSNSNILSPSTIRAYKSLYKTHLADIAQVSIETVPWQKLVNTKAKELSAKSVANVWRLVTASMRFADIEPPKIKLPAVAVSDEPFLDYEQIRIFLQAVEGKEVEVAALLALHSLRRSELMNLTPASIDRKKNIIIVRGARVQNEENRLVSKSTNKNQTSTRNVPIMIPRLLELIPETGDEYLVNCHPNRIAEKIDTVCRHAGLPEVGVHGLRRSFASLAYHLKWDERTVMLVGGWSNIQTVHKFYIKLSSADIAEQTKSMTDFFAGAK